MKKKTYKHTALTATHIKILYLEFKTSGKLIFDQFCKQSTMWKERIKASRNSESLSVFVVKDINGGFMALSEIIVTISNRKTSLEKKMNIRSFHP